MLTVADANQSVDCIGMDYATLAAQIVVDRKCFDSDALQWVGYLSVHYPKMWLSVAAFHTVRIYQVGDGSGMCTCYRSMVDRLHSTGDCLHVMSTMTAAEDVEVSVTVDPCKCFDKMLHLFRRELENLIKNPLKSVKLVVNRIVHLTVTWASFFHFLTHLFAIETKSFNFFGKTLRTTRRQLCLEYLQFSLNKLEAFLVIF